jgi:hypothetical protein
LRFTIHVACVQTMTDSGSQSLQTVRQAVQTLIETTAHLPTLREWYTLTRQPNTSLVEWLQLLYKLESESQTALIAQLQTKIPYFQVEPLDSGEPADATDLSSFTEWLHIGNHTALAGKLIYWLRGLGRSIVLTREYEPVLQLLTEDFREFAVPIVRVDTPIFGIVDRPASIYVQPVFRAIRNPIAPVTLSGSSVIASEELYRILPESMTRSSRGFYDRLVGFLGTPDSCNQWFVKSDALHNVVTHDTKEMDRIRTATYNWTRSPNTYESIDSDAHPGLLMKQTLNGRWYFRYNHHPV